MSEILIDLDYSYTSKPSHDEDHELQSFVNNFARLYPAFVAYFGKIASVSAFSTTHGYHIKFITEDKLSDEDVIFVQAIFHSDSMRELLNWKRVKMGLPMSKFNVLYIKKYIGKDRVSIEQSDPYVTGLLAEIILSTADKNDALDKANKQQSNREVE